MKYYVNIKTSTPRQCDRLVSGIRPHTGGISQTEQVGARLSSDPASSPRPKETKTWSLSSSEEALARRFVAVTPLARPGGRV